MMKKNSILVIVLLQQILMYQIHFNKITVSKPNKYLILVKNAIQTKRSSISNQWTSNPQFQFISIEDVSTLEIRLCEATLDRKIRVVGTAMVKSDQMQMNSDPLFEGELKLQQSIQGNMICVGLVHIKIARQKQQQQFQSIKAPNNTNNSLEAPNQEEQENYELQDQTKTEEDQFQANDQIRIQVHCGFNFYLGSQFYVEAQWGSKLFKTRLIKDKINPIWAQGGRLQGFTNKSITIKVKDSNNNVLQSFKFLLSNLRILFPYHIRLIFKQEYMGATPEVYLSLIRESAAKYSIMQMPLKFGIKNLGETIKNPTYLMITLNPKPEVPTFMSLDRGKYTTIEQTNDYLLKRTLGQQERVDLVGLSNNQSEKNISIFKSYLNRKIYMFLIHISDCKTWFVAHNWQSCRVLESKSDFQAILRKIYYQGQTFTLKKLLQFFNPNQIEQKDTTGKSTIERWKLMTRNYILRNKLVNNSTRHIQELKTGIENQGKQLVGLKKILNEIKTINFSLVGKEKLMNIIKNRSKSNKMFAKQIDTASLISALYDKQSVLQGQKRINSELAMRMDSMAQVQQNQQDLNKDIVQNSKKLLIQQQQISKMKYMQQQLKRQRLIIGELQKIFEKSQMDKQVNEALNEQRQRLNKIKQKKQNQLKDVYKIIKQNNKIAGNLALKVKHAEQTLIKLNQQFAKLTGL